MRINWRRVIVWPFAVFGAFVLLLLVAIGARVFYLRVVDPKLNAPEKIRAEQPLEVVRDIYCPERSRRGLSQVVAVLQKDEVAEVTDAWCSFSGPCYYEVQTKNGLKGCVMIGDGRYREVK